MGNENEMNFETVMEKMKQEMGEVPKPMQLLGELDQSIILNHVQGKNFAFSKEAVPQKYKALIALSGAICLGTPACIMNYTKMAQKSGATVEEIMEAFAVAKFVKGAATISVSEQALEWLSNNS